MPTLMHKFTKAWNAYVSGPFFKPNLTIKQLDELRPQESTSIFEEQEQRLRSSEKPFFCFLRRYIELHGEPEPDLIETIHHKGRPARHVNSSC